MISRLLSSNPLWLLRLVSKSVYATEVDKRKVVWIFPTFIKTCTLWSAAKCRLQHYLLMRFAIFKPFFFPAVCVVLPSKVNCMCVFSPLFFAEVFFSQTTILSAGTANVAFRQQLLTFMLRRLTENHCPKINEVFKCSRHMLIDIRQWPFNCLLYTGAKRCGQSGRIT